MDFFSRCYKSSRWGALVRTLMLCTLACWTLHASAQVATDVGQFHVERTDDEIDLSAQIQFDLPAAVEDALLKGIPVVFVMDADVLRERWYWYDKRLAGAQRQMRLAFQPLSRRWRLNVSSGGSGVGLTLNQSYDTLPQALAAIKRVVKWKIADVADLDSASKCRVEFQFRLDLNQLPRPFQLGAVGPSEWDIGASAQTHLALDSSK